MYNKITSLAIILLLSITTFGQVRINEIQASNTNDYLDFESATYVDWIELYNFTDTLVDLSNYYLSDKLDNKTKWTIPLGTVIQPKSYRLFLADATNVGVHTNFSLSSDGEAVGLFNPKGDTIDAVTFTEQTVDVSYGRSINDENVWGYYYNSTPGKANTTVFSTSKVQAKGPIFSTKGGVYTSAVSTSISSSEEGVIRYTLDGSEPTFNSDEFVSALSFSTTTVVRARLFQDGKLPGIVTSQSYFINENITLPIISITTNPKNLFGDTTGVYVNGVYAKEGVFTSPNYYKDWQKPVNFEYFSKDGKQLMNIQLEYELTGELRNYGLKSFRLNAKGKYGTDYIENKFFDNRLYKSAQTIIVRNGGWPDLAYSLIRDGLIQTLAGRNIDLDYQEYKPCVVFYNGQYYGIQNIREKIDEEFFQNNNGASKDLNLLENHNAGIIEGSNTEFLKLKEYTLEQDLSNDSIFKHVSTNLDIDAFINYQIIQSYSANTDWPIKNIKYWKDNVPNSKWRWIIFDADFGFGLEGKVDHNSIRYIADSTFLESNNPLYSTSMFRSMLENEAFKNKFISKYFTMLDTYYSEENVIKRISELASEIDGEMPRHSTRWPHMYSYGFWKEQIGVIKDFGNKRPDYLRQYLKEYFELDECKNLTVNQKTEGGYFLVNGIKINSKDFVTMSPSNLISQVEAIPFPGYRFKGWGGIDTESTNNISILVKSDTTLTLYFEATGETVLDSVVAVNTTLFLDKSPYLINHDIVVKPNVTLTIEPGVRLLISNKANVFVYGNVHVNGSENANIQIEPNYRSGFDKWGAFVFVNATDSSSFSYVTLTDASNAYDLDRDKAAISSFGSVLSIDHCTIVDVFNQPIFAQESKVYLTNSVIHSKVTGDLINIKRGYGYIDKCEFIGNDQVDTDAIDYDGISNGVIKNSIIHSFYGDNSDGIDLGEQSKNILVENMIIYDCTDKGVSVGQASTTNMLNNVIYACNMGVGIKDLNSYANINKNTFYGNYYGIATFEKNIGSGGGKADVTNSIISVSSKSLFIDQFSSINASYTLFGDVLHSGLGNKLGDPSFKNTNLANFELVPTSIAIDAGDPSYQKDLDNSITDMGAIFKYFGPTKIEGIYINELMSSNSNGITDESGKFEDWVEFYNSNDYAVDISGLYVSDILLNPTLWKIPKSNPKVTRIPAKGFLILWADGDTLQGANHMNLKLSALGERFMLTKIELNDTIRLDEVIFPTMPANSSFSRYGDASNNWVVTTKTTPWMSNNLNLPYFVSDAQAISIIDKEFTFKVITEDLDGDKLVLSIVNKPSWMDFKDNGDGTANLTGTPIELDKGVYNFTIELSDGVNINPVIQHFEVSVNEGILTDTPTYVSVWQKSTIHPNPIVNSFEVNLSQINSIKEIRVSVYDQLGKLVEQFEKKDCRQFVFDSSSWSSGVYFVSISTNDNLLERLKVIKID